MAIWLVLCPIHEGGSFLVLIVQLYTLTWFRMCTWKHQLSLVEIQWGFRMEKSKYLFWNINPHTQHFLWRRIFLGYPYSWLMDAHIRISFTACDEHPLLVLKKSHSHPQRHNHPTFLLPFHSSWLLPSLQFQTCFKLETLPTSQQRQQNRWRRHSISIDLPWDIHFWNLVPWHHLIHIRRSVTTFAGHLVYRFHGGCQIFYSEVGVWVVCILVKRKMSSHIEDSFGGRILNFVIQLLTFI